MAFAAFRNRLIVIAASASLCASAASTAFGAPPASAAPPRPAALDQSRIHSFYTDGEFDKVIKELESFLKSRRACSHAESVFIAKHLSVVYAAHPGTRELGRYHMFRLLDLAPGSDLLDMFVGDEVGGVFEKVGKEYVLRNPSKVPARKPAAANVKSPAVVKAAAPARPGSPARPPTQSNISARAPAQSNPSVRPASASQSPAPAARPPVAYRLPTPKDPPASADRVASRDSAAAPRKALMAEASRPAWKEPGLWIGGGAAFAVVAFTLFYSGPDQAPQGKTYVVPASAAR